MVSKTTCTQCEKVISMESDVLLAWAISIEEQKDKTQKIAHFCSFECLKEWLAKTKGMNDTNGKT